MPVLRSSVAPGEPERRSTTAEGGQSAESSRALREETEDCEMYEKMNRRSQCGTTVEPS